VAAFEGEEEGEKAAEKEATPRKTNPEQPTRRV
jgi:hypothetical protein